MTSSKFKRRNRLLKLAGMPSSTLFHMEQKKWKLTEEDFSDFLTLAVPCHSPSCKHCKRSYGPLLFACKHDPPLKLIQSLLKADPLAAYEADCEEKYPLHIACEYGASPAVVNELIQANARAIKEKDIFDMTPIHLVCKNYLDKVDHDLPKKIAQNCMIEAMRLILIKDPEIILAEGAIEYALESGLSLEVISTLQLAVGKEQKMRRS